MTDSDKEFVCKLIDEVEKRRDIYLSIFIGYGGVSISVYPLEDDEQPIA